MDIPQVISRSESMYGDMGQHYLVCGKAVALRAWTENPSEISDERSRDYETVGYVVSGKLELVLNGETVTLSKGDSWLVPKNAPHQYRIVESIFAIEGTSPPARLNDRDEPMASDRN